MGLSSVTVLINRILSEPGKLDCPTLKIIVGDSLLLAQTVRNRQPVPVSPLRAPHTSGESFVHRPRKAICVCTGTKGRLNLLNEYELIAWASGCGRLHRCTTDTGGILLLFTSIPNLAALGSETVLVEKSSAHTFRWVTRWGFEPCLSHDLFYQYSILTTSPFMDLLLIRSKTMSGSILTMCAV